MQRYKILHSTYYNFSAAVRLEPHSLLLRPREGHELRIESSALEINPPATLRWHRDVEDNSVAIATFDTPASQLMIKSEVIIQQYNQAPLDFLVADYAIGFPFAYTAEDIAVLSPFMNTTGDKVIHSLYMDTADHSNKDLLAEWLAGIWQPGEQIQTYALLQRLSTHIHTTLPYQVREEPGVQSAMETLSRGSGSCCGA